MTNLINANVIEWAASYTGPKFHAMLCDPPYHLTSITERFGKNGSAKAKDRDGGPFRGANGGFMGKQWDGGDIAFDPATWAALAEHLLPGAFIFAFAGTRGYHRMACAIEDAGLIIHPAVGWAFGSGFPKATRIDSQIDKAAGVDRKPVPAKWAGRRTEGSGPKNGDACYGQFDIGDVDTLPATPLAQAWAGHRYGLQALKPAFEFIACAQKPYEGRPVDCITETGAGALWIEGGRIGTDEEAYFKTNLEPTNANGQVYGFAEYDALHKRGGGSPSGRWPSNLILSDDAAARMDEQSGESKSIVRVSEDHDERGATWSLGRTGITPRGHSDTGGASRYFYRVSEQIDDADPVRYVAKASRRERDAGLEGFEKINPPVGTKRSKPDVGRNGLGSPMRNPHPTVKPLALTRYLATLLLPPAEYAPRRLLVPFCGSGSEVIGAIQAGWEDVTGIDLDAEYIDIARARVAYWSARPAQPKLLEVDR